MKAFPQIEKNSIPLAIDSLDLTGLESAFEADVDPDSDVEEFDPLAIESLDLTGFESAFEADVDPDSDVEEFDSSSCRKFRFNRIRVCF